MASPALRRALVAAAAAGALGLGVALRTAELRPPPESASGSPEAGIQIHGGPALARPTRRALDRLLATRIGSRARSILEAHRLSGPVTIELNLRGDHYTPYRVAGEELGETIVFDPWARPLVETERGPLRATLETMLAHELGHAVFKLRSEDDVIREIENPVREELGLPRRLRF